MAAYAIAGVDEVGRGPLAGPVVAAAVVLDAKCGIPGLADSKQLKPATRDRLDQLIRRQASSFALGMATVAEIDRLNILGASLLAMQRAIELLDVMPSLVLVDGNRCPQLNCPAAAVVKGDQRVRSIGAASIIAKVARDRFMQKLHADLPQYGFDVHKGYPTRVHRQALQDHGPSRWHRLSFAPVRVALESRSVAPRTDVI